MKNIKRLTAVALLTVTFVGGMFVGNRLIPSPHKEVKVQKVNQEGSRIITDYTDGSWSVINEDKGQYIFQPVDLGDWDYVCKNKEELRNVITSYLSMKNTGTF